MRKILKDSSIILIFFFVFLFKENIYGLLIKTNELDAINSYIKDVEENYYKNEYNELLRTLNILTHNNYNYQYSKVLYRDIYEFYNEITILKGTKDSIKENSAVINEVGLIGVVKKVSKHSSVVTLITNKNSNISVKINNSYGILKYSNNSLIITSINNYENIIPGEIIYTSGLGNLPEGIKIGEVKSIVNDELGIEKQIIVKPYVDFDNIKYVAILEGENV